MSGSSSPYHLRPNKHIDRNLFLDLLSRLLPSLGVEKYAYISMGAKHLIDHNSVYRKVGIQSLCSFDNNPLIVSRQGVNTPTDQTLCLCFDSSSLVANLDKILNGFDKASNFIVWLDYTSPRRLRQMQEFELVLGNMQPNDIVRITLNADIATLKGDDETWKGEGFDSPAQFRRSNLNNQLGEYMPKDIDKIDSGNFPKALMQCVQNATEKVSLTNDKIKFIPTLATTYQDTSKMFTVTISAVDKLHRPEALASLKSWEFYAGRWDKKIVEITTPDFSLREKYQIDKILSHSPTKILKMLNFNPEDNVQKSRNAIAAYKKLHRYYPTFRNIDL